MRLVDVLVDERNMQPSMYPVDTIICEQEIPEPKTHEQGKGQSKERYAQDHRSK